MRLLVLATTTRDGAPIAGPVDGVFYRGEFWFGSGPESLRFRHIRERPRVSATHLPGEELSVTVHGRAVIEGLAAELDEGAREVFIEIYGEQWLEWGDEALFARIEPARMLTFHLSPEELAAAQAGES